MDEVEVTVIGAGAIGLAVAATLARPSLNLVILEKNPKFGQETSSRNSEVIHSGIYYPPGSLKARLCVEGNKMLYEFCKIHGIAHSRCGKIVVATELGEELQLQHLLKNGIANGVSELDIMTQEQVRELEPEINCIAGLKVPSTGIIDSHAMMRALLTNAQEKGTSIVYNCEAIRIEKNNIGEGFKVTTRDGYTYTSKVVVNSAGLQSDTIAQSAGIDIDVAGYKLHPCKGSYFKMSRNPGVSRLIYPVPVQNLKSLGIHLVLGLDGSVRFGPDAEYIDKIDYAVDEGKRQSFCDAVRKYLPSLNPEELQPDTSGIRPKLQVDGGSFRDFIIAEESSRALPGLINLIGIDSPGLTSALAIAAYVGQLMENLYPFN